MYKRLAVGVCLLSVVGCVPRQHIEIRPAIFSAALQRQAGLTPAQQALADRHCPEGMPQVVAKQAIGPTQLVVHSGYVLEQSDVNKIPLWVCEGVTREQLLGSLMRADAFAPDPLLKPGQRAELKDYKRSGYDRGHQAPAGDQTVDEMLKAETFFLSNMAPQAPALNQQAWSQLEELVRSWITGQSITDAKIITGGFFWDPKEDQPSTAAGLLTIKTIGPDHVAVPTHFYKIVVAHRRGQQQADAIAFVMENKAQTKPFQFDRDIVAIEWLEDRTGLNFMPQLSGPDKDRLEHLPSPMWTN